MEIEEFSVPEFFVQGIAKVDRLNAGMLSMLLYSERWNDAGKIVKFPVLRLIRPAATCVDSARIIGQVMASPSTPRFTVQSIMRMNA